MNVLARTAFVTSLYSYGFFVLADYIRPGFVSYVFSVHLWLIPIFFFGILWGFVYEPSERKIVIKAFSVFSCLIVATSLSFIVIREASFLGDFQLVIALVVFLTPWIGLALARAINLVQDEVD